MTEKKLPAEEHRGGDKPDWVNVDPYEELPELQDDYPEPASEPLPGGPAGGD